MARIRTDISAFFKLQIVLFFLSLRKIQKRRFVLIDAVELVVLENVKRTSLCIIQVFSDVTVGNIVSIFTLQD